MKSQVVASLWGEKNTTSVNEIQTEEVKAVRVWLRNLHDDLASIPKRSWMLIGLVEAVTIVLMLLVRVG